MNNNAPAKSWFNVNVMGLGHFTSDFYCNLLPLMLPILARRFGLSYAECGTLYMIFQVAANFIQPPLGLLADRRNLNYLMPLSILGGGIFACAIGIVDNVYMLAFIIFISGICASGFHPIGGGILPNVSPYKKEVLSTSIFIVYGNVGFAIAPYCVARYVDAFGPNNLIWLSIPAIFTAALIYKQRLHHPTLSENPQDVSSLKSILHNKPFAIFVMSIGWRSLCYCSLIAYLPLFMTERGYSNTQSAQALFAMLFGTAFGGLAVGGLSAKLGLKKLILLTYIATICSVTWFLYKADLSFTSYVLLFITGAGLYGSTPPAIVWSQRMLSKSAAFATSMMLGFTFGIGYIVSVGTGILADFFGMHTALWITIIPSLILAIILLIPLKEPPCPEES